MQQLGGGIISFETFVKDESNGENDSYRTSLLMGSVVVVRKTSKKGKKYADYVTDSDLMALVCKINYNSFALMIKCT
jgi:hypothetical protein